MAELLVRIRARDGDDALRYDRGDVIMCKPDGHLFSERERTNPDWTIIRAPGVDPALLVHLTEPDVDQGRLFARRINALDLDNPAVSGKTEVTARNLQDAGRLRQPMRP